MNDARAKAIYPAFMRHMHWVMAGLIAIVFVLGLTVDAFPKSWDPAIVAIHMDLGLLIIGLLIARLAYRSTHDLPPSTNADPTLRLLEKLGHSALYLLIFAVCALGIFYSIKRGRAFEFGLFSIGPFMPADRAGSRWIREVHEWAAFALVAVALGHAAMAVWHQYVKQDGVLRRMLPGLR